MHTSTHTARTLGGRLGAALAVSLSAVVITAGTALAAPGNYAISATGGATFQLLTANNLATTTTDDVLFYLSTTSSGNMRMPFPLMLYNKQFTKMAISSNGNVQLSVSPGFGHTDYTNTCLPADPPFTGATIMPYWDDLFFDPADTSHGFIEGIFTKTSGAAPHRKFIISWQGHEFGSGGAQVLAQVVFQERSQTFTFVYGLSGGPSATVGSQSSGGNAFTQWACNSASATTVLSGMKLTFLHS